MPVVSCVGRSIGLSAAFVCWLIVTGFAPIAGTAHEWPNDERPNIVIFYADDLGYGDVGCFNRESKIPTPEIDRLAAQGTCFFDAHSSSGICTPSRFALLMGQYHWRRFHGIVNSFDPPVFREGDWTLAELLQARGYRTACIGKWHLGWNWDTLRTTTEGPIDRFQDMDWNRPVPGGPCDHGFDYYFGDDVPNFPPYTWIEKDRVLIRPTERFAPDPVPTEGVAEGRPGPMAPGWKLDGVMPTLCEKAERWIADQAQQEEPFFLYFPFTSPHAPIVPAAPFQGHSAAGPFGDYVYQTDWTVGRILKALERIQRLDNTLVIFCSDNGPEKYAYPRWRDFDHRSAGPLRGLKRDIWEGGHRVPLVIRWPGRVPAGRTSDALISQIDLYATIAAIVSAEIPETAGIDSHDQRGLLFGTDAKGSRRSLVHNTNRNHYAIREDQWVLINAPSGTVTKVPDWVNARSGYEENEMPVALFDLSKDLGQRTNLAGEYPERVKAMQSLLASIQAKGEVRGKDRAGSALPADQ